MYLQLKSRMNTPFAEDSENGTPLNYAKDTATRPRCSSRGNIAWPSPVPDLIENWSFDTLHTRGLIFREPMVRGQGSRLFSPDFGALHMQDNIPTHLLNTLTTDSALQPKPKECKQESHKPWRVGPGPRHAWIG